MLGDRKRLLFVITQGVVGGAQKYVFDLARYFNQSGNYDVSAAIGGEPDADLFKKLAGEKIKTHHLKFLGREVKIGDDILAFFKLLQLFKKEKPDIIHLNSSKIGLMGALAGYFSGVRPKIIFTAHGWIFKEDLSRLARNVAVLVARLAAKFQDRIICVSQDDFDKAVKNKVAPARKLYVVHNAVSEAEFLARTKARAQISRLAGHDFAEDDFLLINPGRLYATKGLNYLIEAVKSIKGRFHVSGSKFHDVFLVIFGDGPEREALKLQVTSSKLQGSVFFVGDVLEMSQYLRAFDALVLSSVKEGFPYSILEAGLAEVPVIATDVGGIGEVIEDGKTGLLIKPKNPLVLAEAVLKIVSDAAGAKKLARELKKTIIQKFTFEIMTQKTEWVYRV